uniref:Sema domain-containing protein n=1 Tax=Sphaeramia orbicularis TaxID=375764 RepID=A0A673ASJ3_9TELE
SAQMENRCMMGRPLVHFNPPDVQNTTTLLLSNDSSTLYVGAQNAILSLDVSRSDVIQLKTKMQWSPSETEITECTGKGKSTTVDCPNFISVLQPINSTHLYACGSYAYSPHDAFIDAESLAMVQHQGAKGRCPFNPFQRSITTTVDGELFTATMSDFRGVIPQISRHFSKGGRPDISQDSSVSFLEEPTFVSSSSDATERKLYFFFTEVGKEFSFVNKLQIARVAQVCKDDVGGEMILQKKWTSFAKASLLCQSQKQFPFNILQDMFTLHPPEGSGSPDTLFYGVFTSQWSLSAESAVCAFRLQDIRNVFNGNYMTFDMNTDLWSPLMNKHSYLGTCGQDKSTEALLEVKKSFLTSNSVQPLGDRPLIVSLEQRYSRVTAMRTTAADGKDYTILFLLTESGFLHKVVLLDQGPRVIEEIQVFTKPQLIKNMVLSTSKGVVFVGTSEGVTSVPVAQCSIYRTCSQCVLARDPLCGWSRTRSVCTRMNTSENLVQDLENVNTAAQCDGQTVTVLGVKSDYFFPTEVNTNMNEPVTLLCSKPSNLATVKWSTHRFTTLPEELFVQSADGSLRFFATARTYGTYICEAEEDGNKEIVVRYTVQPGVLPRSNKTPNWTTNTEEPYEDIETHKPTTQPSGVQPFKEQPKITKILKSYHSELIVVSLLLTICICILMLGGFHIWRQMNMNQTVSLENGDTITKCMESTPSLSSPEDAGPELKVVDRLAGGVCMFPSFLPPSKDMH